MPIDVEVLIVSYGSDDAIERCLASLALVAPRVAVSIREHGAGPIDRLAALAAQHPSEVRLSQDPSNPGFGAGCNALARQAAASWLMFLNPDTETLTWPWDDDAPGPDTIVGPTMVESGPPGGHAGRSYRLVDEIGRSWLRRRGEAPTGTGFVSGAALLIESTTFARLNGFDERYFLFYEDIDLCLRANSLGVGTFVSPTWTVRHAGAHSTSARFAEAITWSYESGSRFHSERGTRLTTYRSYVIVDSMLRAALATVHDRRRSTAYLGLARRAWSDVLGRRAAP